MAAPYNQSLPLPYHLHQPFISTPPPPLPAARPRPPRQRRPTDPSSQNTPTTTEHDRLSGLRASVLETAIGIGFGNNNTVAKWIFSNPLAEEDEEDDTPTSLSASTSASSPNSFLAEGFSTPSPRYLADPKLQPFPSVRPKIDTTLATAATAPSSSSSLVLPSSAPGYPSEQPKPPNPFDVLFPRPDPDRFIRSTLSSSPSSLSSTSFAKMSKKGKKDDPFDGYQSEGSALSNRGRVTSKLKKDKPKKKKDVGNDDNGLPITKTSRDTPSSDVDPGFLSDSHSGKFSKRSKSKASIKSTKSTPSTPKDSRSLSPTSSHSAPTSPLGPSSPSHLRPINHQQQQQQQQRVSKSRSFFRIKATRKSDERSGSGDGGQRDKAETIPPVPAMPLPIAEMFARSNTSSTTASSTAPSVPAPMPGLLSVHGEGQAREIRSSWGSEVVGWTARPTNDNHKGGPQFDFHLEAPTPVPGREAAAPVSPLTNGVVDDDGTRLTAGASSLSLSSTGSSSRSLSPAPSTLHAASQPSSASSSATSFVVIRGAPPAADAGTGPRPGSAASSGSQHTQQGGLRAFMKSIPAPLALGGGGGGRRTSTSSSSAHGHPSLGVSPPPQQPFYQTPTPLSSSSSAISLPLTNPHATTRDLSPSPSTPFINRSPSPRPPSVLSPTPTPTSLTVQPPPTTPNRRSRLFIPAAAEADAVRGGGALSSSTSSSWHEIPPPAPAPTGPLPLPPREAHGRAPVQPYPPYPYPQQQPSVFQRGREPAFPPRPVLPAHVQQQMYGGSLPAHAVNGHVPRYAPGEGVRRAYTGRGARAAYGDEEDEEDEEPRDRQLGVAVLSGILSRYEDERQQLASSALSPSMVGKGDMRPFYGEEGEDEGEDDLSQYSDPEDVRYAYPPRQRPPPPPPPTGALAPTPPPAEDARTHQRREREKRRRQTVYSDDGGDDDDDDAMRYSRYTASVYSVNSVIDDKKSGELRERFVRRVQALYARDRGARDVVPPVPKLPEGVVRGARG